MRILLALLAALNIVGTLNAQQYRLDYYGQNKGLNNPFIYTIDQDSKGFLVVGTGEGIGLFDGSDFRMMYKKDGLTEDFVSSSYNDSGKIWFGHKDGGLTLYENNVFESIHSGEGVGSRVVDIDSDGEGRVWYAAQNFGLACINFEGEMEFYGAPFKDEVTYGFTCLSDGNMIVLGQGFSDLYRFDEEDLSLSKVQSIPGIPDDQVLSVDEIGPDKVLVSTFHSGCFIINKNNGSYVAKPVLTDAKKNYIIRNINVQDSIAWVSTLSSGLVKFRIKQDSLIFNVELGTKKGLRSNIVNCSFMDREGVVWIGTYGEGLVTLGEHLFSFYCQNYTTDYKVTAIKVNEREIWTGAGGNVDQFDKESGALLRRYSKVNGLPDRVVTALLFTSDSTLYVGTEQGGLMKKLPGDTTFSEIKLSDEFLSRSITSLASNGEKLWIGSFNGIYVLDLKTSGLVSYSVSSGLPHNAVGTLLMTENDSLYVGTRSSSLSKFNDGAFINIPLNEDFHMVNVNMIARDKQGNFWMSTSDKGVLKLDPSYNIEVYGTDQGLESNYCYGLAIGIDGAIWVSHNGGLSCIDPYSGRVELFDNHEGVNLSFNRGAMDVYGSEVWFGSDKGMVVYNSVEDTKNEVSPISSIVSVKCGDFYISPTEFHKLSYGEYDLIFEYKGVSLRNQKDVKYEFILEGYDEEWSDITNVESARYSKVTDGEYVFKVRAFNADGVIGEYAQFSFQIRKPFWKSWWFYVAVFVVIIVSFVLIIKQRERNLLRRQKQLETELAIRTKEVVAQKERIELINKDLTDSINYAKRIQHSVLPEQSELNRLFPSHFVLYRPKAIVSGDFYWVREVDGKRIIAVGDCTGHGVPGGFMSMIAAILLYETVILKGIIDPAKMCEDINHNLIEVLRQRDDFKSNKDGMDISIAVIDNETLTMRTAGAMRPILVYREGIVKEIKGDRFSLGGSIVKGKTFVTKEYQLMKGDTLYQFSDGYGDQFGGPNQKKMKTKTLVELLDQICYKPMGEQKKELDEFFENWRGEKDQMDDVIVTGIRI